MIINKSILLGVRAHTLSIARVPGVEVDTRCGELGLEASAIPGAYEMYSYNTGEGWRRRL